MKKGRRDRGLRYAWVAYPTRAFAEIPRVSPTARTVPLDRRTGQALPQLAQVDRLVGEEKRLHRVFALGLAHLKGAWARGEYPTPGQLTPEPWPESDHEYATVSEDDFDDT